MNTINNLSKSFVQSQRNLEKTSERYVPLSAMHVAEVLQNHKFNLIHYKEGYAKKEEFKDFQTTISRYRSVDKFEVDGLYLDVILKNPHLGRGCGELILGLFRGICSNQLSVGYKFGSIKVRHNGSPIIAMRDGIEELMSKRENIIRDVTELSKIELSDEKLLDFAKKAYTLKVGTTNNKLIPTNDQFGSLLQVRRAEDTKRDVFTALNVIQENVIKYNQQYTMSKVDENENTQYLEKVTRKLDENSARSLELNRELWDLAVTLSA